jgi:hypothetical protein
MRILNELSNLIEDEDEDFEDRPILKKPMRDEEDMEDEEEDEDIGEILKHIEAVQAAAKFIDTLTTDQGNTTAFEAEVALRKSIERMKKLSDEVYKNKRKEEKKF